MSKPYLIAAAIFALAAGSLAQAQSAGPAATLKPEEVIKARQAAYMLSAGDFGGMKSAADHGEDITHLTFNAGGLVRWANVIPTMFPAGTGQGETPVPTKARPEIWSDRAGFEAAAANYAAEAVKLRDAAKSGNKEAFNAQWEVVRGACAACHDKYRAK